MAATVQMLVPSTRPPRRLVRLVQVTSLDDLKDRLGKLVLLILVIEFFRLVLLTGANGVAELLYLALGTVLVSGALYLTGRIGK